MSDDVGYSLSVDPATHGCGATLWRGRSVAASAYVPNPADDKASIVRRCAAAAEALYEWAVLHALDEDGRPGPRPMRRLILELPQIYSRGANKTKGDPNTCVLPLAMIDCALSALMPAAEVNHYQPHAWKGGTQKPERAYDASGKEILYVIKRKVQERITAEELKRVDWSRSIAHSWDVADAIGVGLHHFGRFEPRRVFARD